MNTGRFVPTHCVIWN